MFHVHIEDGIRNVRNFSLKRQPIVYAHARKGLCLWSPSFPPSLPPFLFLSLSYFKVGYSVAREETQAFYQTGTMRASITNSRTFRCPLRLIKQIKKITLFSTYLHKSCIWPKRSFIYLASSAEFFYGTLFEETCCLEGVFCLNWDARYANLYSATLLGYSGTASLTNQVTCSFPILYAMCCMPCINKSYTCKHLLRCKVVIIVLAPL